MVDAYSWFAIGVRIIASLLFIGVLYQQYKELRIKNEELFPLKIRLTVTVVLLFLANILALVLNFYRQEDGNLIITARHLGVVLNAVATLAVADSFRAIYKYNREG